MADIFAIHRINHTSHVQDVTLPSGDTAQAAVFILEVELVPEVALHGSLTLRFTGEQARMIGEGCRRGQRVEIAMTPIADEAAGGGEAESAAAESEAPAPSGPEA